MITAQGGTVGKAEYWGLRNLSYRVKKHRKGHYLHLNLDAPAAAITELERTQRIHEDVLRYLTVRVEAFEEGPSQVMVAKSSRDERGPRRDFDGAARPAGIVTATEATARTVATATAPNFVMRR